MTNRPETRDERPEVRRQYIASCLLALASCLFLGGTAAGAKVEQVKHALWATVGVRVGRSHGSGTLIHAEGTSGLVVSCAHVFRDEPQSQIEVDVFAPVPCVARGRLLAIDPVTDVSVIEIQAPDDFTLLPAAIAPRGFDLSPGDTVWNSGCGHGGAPRLLQTTVQPDNFVGDFVSLAGPQTDGRSGGGVFKDGYFCAVVHHSDGRFGLASGIASVYAALDKAGLKETQYCADCQAPPMMMAPPMQAIPQRPVATTSRPDPRLDALDKWLVWLKDFQERQDNYKPQAGPPGEDGEDGRDGKDCDPARVAQLEKRVDELTKIVQEMRAKKYNLTVNWSPQQTETVELPGELNMRPFTAQIWDSGSLRGEREIYPGETLPLERYLITKE